MRTTWIATGFIAGIAAGAVLPALAQIQLASVLNSGSYGLVTGSNLMLACSSATGVVSPGKAIEVIPAFSSPTPETYMMYQLRC